MEEQNQDNSIFIYVLLFLVVVGGGIGVFLATRKKNEPETAIIDKNAPATGRTTTALTDEEIIKTTIVGSPTENVTNTIPAANVTDPPIYIHSPAGKAYIDAMVTAIQKEPETVNKTVARYNIGSPFVDTQFFTPEAQVKIKEMFAQIPGVVSTNPHTYPVYGTQESNGAAIRAQLQNLVSRGLDGINLTNKRDSTAPWWLPALDLNLMTGTRQAGPMDAHSIWSGWEDSKKLEHYKHLNGHYPSEYKFLVEINSNGKAGYPGGGILKLAETWITEIDRLDAAIREDAIALLQKPIKDGGRGLKFTLIDPATNTSSQNQTAK